MVLRLSEAPEQWHQLRDDPRRAAALVEEGLRLASPVQGMFGRVTRATTLGGMPLPEGAIVFLSFISANRDRTVFDSPDDFNPDRPNARKHVSFGQGIHSCLGNVLARMEAAAVLRDLAECVDRLEVVDPRRGSVPALLHAARHPRASGQGAPAQRRVMHTRTRVMRPP